MVMHHTKPRSSLRDLKPLWIEPGIEMPGYYHHVAPRRPTAKSPKRPTQNDFGTAFVSTGQPEMSPERARPRAQQRCQPSRPRNIQRASPSVPCCGRGRPHSAKRPTQNDFDSGVRPQRRRRGIFVEPKPK